MKESIYFKFFSIVKISFISVILTEVLYFFICMKTLLKNLVNKNSAELFDSKEALEIISTKIPKVNIVPEYKDMQQSIIYDLSIIVPVYNDEQFVRQMLTSIINQKTDYSFEIIVLDDGSTDSTSTILDEYINYPNIKIVHKVNEGACKARNDGIEMATGRYLMFVDHDDMLANNTVDLLLKEAYSSDCDMVACGYEIVFYHAGNEFSRRKCILPKYNIYHYSDKSEILNYHGVIWGKVYKRELWTNVRHLLNVPSGDSIVQFLIYPQVTRYKYLPFVGYYYYLHDTNEVTQLNSGANINCIRKYWFVLSLIERYKELKYEEGELFYILMLKHLSVYYYPQIKNLDEKIVVAMYSLARQTYFDNNINCNKRVPFSIRLVEKAFKENNYQLWKSVSGIL